MKRVDRSDDGFTLPELLVAVVVTAIVMPVLMSAFVNGVKTTTGTTERLSASNDAEFASSWFVPDVQSGESFSLAPAACFAPPASGATHLLTITRNEGATPVVVGYGTEGDGTGERSLVRYACTNGTKDPTVTVVHSLNGATTPSVNCTPSPCGSATTKVSLTVVAQETQETTFTFFLNASRRTS